MEVTRNHYMALGTIILLLGIQLRFVESYLLTPETSRFIAEKFEKKKTADPNPFANLLSIPSSSQGKTVRPPKWLGWSLVSIGAVLIIHSLALKRRD